MSYNKIVLSTGFGEDSLLLVERLFETSTDRWLVSVYLLVNNNDK